MAGNHDPAQMKADAAAFDCLNALPPASSNKSRLYASVSEIMRDTSLSADEKKGALRAFHARRAQESAARSRQVMAAWAANPWPKPEPKSPILTRIRRGFEAITRAAAPGATERRVANANDAADLIVTTTVPRTPIECLRYIDLIIANDRGFLDAVPLKGLENLRAGLEALAA